MRKKSKKVPEDELGGTCCPSCGKKQSHIHCGWLANDVLFTRVPCENKNCEDDSLIIRLVKKEQDYPDADVREKLSGEEQFRTLGDIIINHFKEEE